MTPEAAVPQARASASGELRATQTFVDTMAWCWRHPSVTALEVLWRWMFGIPALALLAYEARHIRQTTPVDVAALERMTPADPMGSLTTLARTMLALGPPVLHALAWMFPLLVCAWLLAVTFGRQAVLLRVDPGLHRKPATVFLLQATRVAALLGSFAAWLGGLSWAANVAITAPMAQGEGPNLILYFALAIGGTLVLFVVWALVSWIFSMAPLLAMLENTGIAGSLRRAARLGPMRMKLVEQNLVMGIVKVALLVLAMVFSACPLPFQSVATAEFLGCWWAAVAVLYLLASDFFHAARVVATLQLWRVYSGRI